MRDPVAYADAIYSAAYVSRLCPDILLKAFGTVYPVHRVILASQSVFFATLLRWVIWQPCEKPAAGVDKEEWSWIPSHELVLGEDVTRTGFEWILEYFYGSPRLKIASDNAFDVLAAAHYLGVMAVQKACVNFISQHLDPHNFTACLAWATRVDHGEVSDMLATSCRRILALRLPRHLHTWAPAVIRLEPRALLEILASDFLAVQSEYDRYVLVKAVVQLFVAAEKARSGSVGASCVALECSTPAGVTNACMEPTEYRVAECTDGSRGPGRGGCAAGRGRRGSEDSDSGACNISTTGGRSAAAGVGGGGSDSELQHMLSLALNVEAAELPRHLRLTPSCPSAIPLRNHTASACSRVVTVQPPSTVQCGAWGRSSMEGPLHGEGSAVSGDVSCPVSDAVTGSFGSSLEPGSSVGALSGTIGTSPRSRSGAAGSVFGSATSSRSRIEVTNTCEEDTSSLPRSAPAVGDLQSARRGATANRHRSGSSSSDGDGESCVNGGFVAIGGGAGSVTTGSIGGLLLREAVRYEHLTVPQLMSVQQEGLLPQEVFHAALWNRTRLEYAVQHPSMILGISQPPAANTASASASAPGTPAVTASATAAAAVNGFDHHRLSREALDPPPQSDSRAANLVHGGTPGATLVSASAGNHNRNRRSPASPSSASLSLGTWPPPLPPSTVGTRPFRICWVLPVHVLRKLQPMDSVQSPYHAYAGALWQIRVCYSAGSSLGSDGGRGKSGRGAGGGGEAPDSYLGVYLGRQKPGNSHTAAAELGLHILTGYQHIHRAAAAGGLLPGGGDRHRMRGAAPAAPLPPAPRPRNPPPRPNQVPGGQPAAAAQQQGLRPQPERIPPGAAGAVLQAVVPGVEPSQPQPQQNLQPWLRSRCRMSVLQSDNTMLQGRLCMGDSGEFTAEFVPGGYFGQARLLARSDLSSLPECAEVMVFVVVQALAGYMDGDLMQEGGCTQ